MVLAIVLRWWCRVVFEAIATPLADGLVRLVLFWTGVATHKADGASVGAVLKGPLWGVVGR